MLRWGAKSALQWLLPLDLTSGLALARGLEWELDLAWAEASGWVLVALWGLVLVVVWELDLEVELGVW